MSECRWAEWSARGPRGDIPTVARGPGSVWTSWRVIYWTWGACATLTASNARSYIIHCTFLASTRRPERMGRHYDAALTYFKVPHRGKSLTDMGHEKSGDFQRVSWKDSLSWVMRESKRQDLEPFRTWDLRD